MSEYKILTQSGSMTVEADKIEEKTTHYALLSKGEVVAVCPKTTQFIVVKVG